MPARKPPPEPYRTLTPWAGFTPRERKREVPLPRCPSAQCQRRKACCMAIDGLYCRRTHLTPEEQRKLKRHGTTEHREGGVLVRGARGRARPGLESLPPNASFEQVQAYRMMSDLRLAQAEDAAARLLAKWKSGALDHVHGKYDPKGVWKRPPERGFVEDEGAKRGR